MIALYYRVRHSEEWVRQCDPIYTYESSNDYFFDFAKNIAEQQFIGHFLTAIGTEGNLVPTFWTVPRNLRSLQRRPAKYYLTHLGWRRIKRNGRKQWVKIDERQLTLKGTS